MMTDPRNHLLSIRQLRVTFSERKGAMPVLDGISFDIRHGETLCIVGESGSGKSVTALSVLRLIEREGGKITDGQILFCEQRGAAAIDLVPLGKAALRQLRGRAISMIFQEPMSSLNPAHTIGAQIGEAIRAHETVRQKDLRPRVLHLLERVRLPDPDRLIDAHPHELSGGMQQRVMIAMALALKPALLIADEPTTALDVTVQAEILDLLDELKKETGMSILFITHDMSVVAQMADRVIVMRHGRVVENNDVNALLRSPQHPYTRQLLSAVAMTNLTVRPSPPDRACLPNLVEIRDLVTQYPLKTTGPVKNKSFLRAVDGISFDIRPGEILSIVGESGSGKSTLGKSILRLIEPAAGEVRFEGQDILRQPAAQLRQTRRHMQMVFQNPYGSLNPRRNVFHQIAEPLRIHKIAAGAEIADRVEELARRVGISSDMLNRYPDAFSGGQRQRLCIARALALSPKLVVADEAVSALDASVRAQVLELMLELKDELGLTYLFISHDIGVVSRISDRIGVMHGGKMLEIGPARTICETPTHAYTQALLNAAPKLVPPSAHAASPEQNIRAADLPRVIPSNCN